MKRFLLSFFLCACCLLSALGQEGYPAIDNDYVPITYKIDTRNEVGQIDITSGVSPTGAPILSLYLLIKEYGDLIRNYPLFIIANKAKVY